MASIPISQLNLLNVISSSDYIPIVQQHTTTTFNTQMQTVANWISASVESSSSVAALSASYSVSSSWSNNSNQSISSSYLNYPNNSTTEYSISSSRAITSSFALEVLGGNTTSISSSFASQSMWNISSSFASHSLTSASSSFASQSMWNISSSFASQSMWNISSSFASHSLTSASSSFANNALTSSYIITNVAGTPYPYIYSMSFYATHDDCIDICYGDNPIYTWNNVPGTYNGWDGFTSSSITSSVGMFVYKNNATSLLHTLTFNPNTNCYVMSVASISALRPATGSITGPQQIMTLFSDNRGSSGWYLYFQSPIVVTFAIGIGQYKTYTMNFNNPTGTANYKSATITVDARLINYQIYNPTIYPIYQNFGVTGPFSPSVAVPLQIFSITSQ